MYSSGLRCKQLIMCLIISFAPLTISANLPAPYLQDDSEDAVGALPSLEAPDFPDFVQTYPIDEHYGEAKITKANL